MRAAFLVIICILAAATPAAAHPPYGLVVDSMGNAYFSDLETVWRCSPEGRLSVFRPPVEGTHVHALARAPDGAVEGDQNRYDPVSERFFSGLWRRTLAGAESAVVPLTERPPLGSGVWQDSAGNRYTSHWLSSDDRRVVLRRQRADGWAEVLFDEAGGGPHPPQQTVESVGGMAFGADRSVFFTNGGVLRRVSADGRVATLYEGSNGSSLRGLAVVRDGSVLAADMGAKTVLAVSPDGMVSTLYRETDAWSPTAVAVSGSRLLVLEANDDPYSSDRVRLIEVIEGRRRVIASPARGQIVAGRSEGDGTKAGVILVASLAALVTMFGVWRFRR